MNKRTINFIAVLIGALAFNFIFWKEDVALNFTLFSLFSMLVNFINSPEMFSRRNVQITTAGNLVACFFLLYHHSIVSIVAALTSWIIMIGFYQIDELRSVHRAFLSSIINFFRLPPFLLNINWKERNISKKSINRKFTIVLFPLIALMIFYWIFLEANPVFAELNDSFWHDVTWFFETYLFEINIERVAFFLLGFLICSWFIYKAIYTFVYDEERPKKIDLFRVRNKRKKLPLNYPSSMIKGLEVGLKNENRSGVLMMGLISVLLLFVNVIDIVYVWFGNEFNPTTNYSADVHKGVNLLIFSIFLSIFIMIYFFRRNQNFYKKNNILKQMAYFWILQNVILIISVIFRNAHYIQFHGLTQKRIGVFVFLVIVVLGLISLTLKIAQRKSFFYLSKFNSWSLYGVLIFLACFNWDMIIFNHNFTNRHEKAIDLTYLVDLSDEVILEIDKHKDVLFKEYKIEKENHLYSRSRMYQFTKRMNLIEYNVEHDERTLFSWNYRKVKIENIVKDVKLPPNRAALDMYKVSKI